MVYWKRPQFWFALIIAEVAAVIASGLIAIATYVALRWTGVSPDAAGGLINPVGLIMNVILAYIAFIWTRWDYRQRTKKSAFEVVVQSELK